MGAATPQPKSADLVLSGGGVKFIGLVGAIVALMDAGYSFHGCRVCRRDRSSVRSWPPRPRVTS